MPVPALVLSIAGSAFLLTYLWSFLRLLAEIFLLSGINVSRSPPAEPIG